MADPSLPPRAPHCRTLEEMRMLRPCPPPDPPACAIASAAPPLLVAAGGATVLAAPNVVAACASRTCLHGSTDCFHFRLMRDWCVVCRQRVVLLW